MPDLAAVPISNVLVSLILSGLMGTIGQGIRAIAGLKKLNDFANSGDPSSADVFITSRLVVSLLIGFIAGAIAGIATGFVMGPGSVSDAHILLGLAAAGYAGTDFIEAMASKILTSSNPQSNPQQQSQRSSLAALDQTTYAARLPQPAAPAPAPFGPCGGVYVGAKPLSASTIKQYILDVSGANLGPNPSDKTPLSDLDPGADASPWDLAQACQRYPKFEADGLNIQPLYVSNCKTLGDMVKCIQCCYRNPVGSPPTV